MTDYEINIALCKWDGWKFQQGEEPAYGAPYKATGWFNPQGVFLSGKNANPRYTTSLDALAPLEARLTEEQWDRYLDEVMEVVGFNRRHIFSATAAQKASALVRALGLDGREV